MDRDVQNGWDVIERDPVLRIELNTIERTAGSADDLVDQLIDFYNKVDKKNRFTQVLSSFLPENRLAGEDPGPPQGRARRGSPVPEL